MAPFRLEVSNHAAERLQERGITRPFVRQCIATGALIGLDVNGRQVRELKMEKRRLVVVYLQVKGGALVVTAYWKE